MHSARHAANPSVRADRPVALVTGASRGIGAAAAREFARRGYAVVLAARSAGAIQALAGELSRAGAPALPVPTDLCDEAAVARLARIALEQMGRVDVLVHNAGIGGGRQTLMGLTDDTVAEQFAANLVAPVALTRALLPQMLARRSGAIVFVASVAGHIGLPTSTVYSATKFGMRGFALGLRREVGRFGIGVSIVSPGFIATAMTEGLRGVPMIAPEPVARVIADVAEHPRRELFVPGYYRAFTWVERLAPWLVDAALRLAGR